MNLSLVAVVVVAGVGTYLTRAIPLVWGSRAMLPAGLERWLSFVTPAILGALLAPSIFLPDGHWEAPWHDPIAWAAIPTAAVAWRSRNLLLTVLAGILFFALTRHIVS